MCARQGWNTESDSSPATIEAMRFPEATTSYCFRISFMAKVNEANESLVRKLVSNLQSGGRFVVKDHILDESLASPPVGAVFSLLMLLTTISGRCYSFNEIRLWMERANLSQVQKLDLPPPFTSSLVVGTK